MHTAFYSKKLSQFISEQRLFVLQTFPSAALSKITLAVSVLILDSEYPEQAMAAVPISYWQPRYTARLVSQLLSALVKRTHLPVQRCTRLTDANLVVVNNVPSPPLQIHFMHFAKALWPPVSPTRTVTGTRLSSTAADAWYHALALAQSPHTTPQACNTSLSSDFIAGESAARPGPARPGSDGADSLTDKG